MPGINSLAYDRAFAHIGQIFGRERFERLCDSDVVFHLALRSGSADCHMDRHAQSVREALARTESPQKKRLAEYLDGLDYDALRYRYGQGGLFDAEVGVIGGVDGHEHGIPSVVRLQQRSVRLRIIVAGETDEAALTRLLRCLEGFQGAAGPEYGLDFLWRANIVHLPDVEVIGLEGFERDGQLLLGFVAGGRCGVRGLEVMIVRELLTPAR